MHPLLTKFAGEPLMVATHSGAAEAMLRALTSSEVFDKLAAATNDNEFAYANDNADGFWPEPDDWKAFYRPYNVVNGVLMIPVKGLLLNNFPWALGGYATGYEYIWRAYRRGMDDPAVTRIALVIDSPGGMVAGNFDLVDRMFEMRDQKPVWAFAHESAYSAAYSIASVAKVIVVSRTGGVGSIGVVTSHVDVSAAMESAGYKITFIHFGDHKVDGNPYEALPEAVKARIQARIDEMGELFVATVARNRNVDAEAVRGTQALTYSATQAVESEWLADRIGPLDDSLLAFAQEDVESDNVEDDEMSTYTKEQYDQAVASARADGVTAGKAEAAAEKDAAVASAVTGAVEAMATLVPGNARVEAVVEGVKDGVPVATAVKMALKIPEAPQAKAEDGATTGPDNRAVFQQAMDQSGNPNVSSASAPQPSTAEATMSMVRSLKLSGFKTKAAG